MATSRPLSPRRRPVQGRSRETVEVILAAAAQVLERQGLAGFTTNAVALRAGVSIGSLYQYFPNKESLTAALIERSTESLRASLAEAVDRAAALPFQAGLALLVNAAAAHQIARPSLERTLDDQEQRLGLAGLEDRNIALIQAEIVRFLEPHRASLVITDLSRAAGDALAIGRALIDAAAVRGDLDCATLEQHLVRTLCAFLTGTAQPTASETI